MAKAKDPYQVKINNQLIPYSESNETKAFGIHFKDLKCSNLNFHEFDGSLFENVSFDQSIEALSFVDCIFNHCDFSSIKLKSAYFLRCEFNACKALGSNFSKSKFSYTSIKDSMFSMADFSECICDHLRLQNSDYSQSSFVYCKFDGFITENINFTSTDFTATSLENCDFSSCELHGASVTTVLIKGLTINEQQAVAFTKLFGLKIS